MKASASATASSAMSSAAAFCCISSMRPGENAGADYRTIRRELAAYGAGLADKAEIVALSKVDAVDRGDAEEAEGTAEARACANMAPTLADGRQTRAARWSFPRSQASA